jgi:hypothetical protein
MCSAAEEEARMVAPFFFEHCVTCGRDTKHWHNGDPARVPGGECDECGTYFEEQPKDDRYWVTFTNLTDLSVKPAAGQYYLGKCLTADSEAEAFAEALQWALGVKSRVGMPPHGIEVSEEELRRQATVIPDLEAFHEGYWEALNRRMQLRRA